MLLSQSRYWKSSYTKAARIISLSVQRDSLSEDLQDLRDLRIEGLRLDLRGDRNATLARLEELAFSEGGPQIGLLVAARVRLAGEGAHARLERRQHVEAVDGDALARQSGGGDPARRARRNLFVLPLYSFHICTPNIAGALRAPNFSPYFLCIIF